MTKYQYESDILNSRVKNSKDKTKIKCIDCNISNFRYGIHTITVGVLEYTKKNPNLKQQKEKLEVCTYKCSGCNYLYLDGKLCNQIRERLKT